MLGLVNSLIDHQYSPPVIESPEGSPKKEGQTPQVLHPVKNASGVALKIINKIN